jgi:hypothetical protein
MGMKNFPIDTRCKRSITRGGRRLDAWLAHDCPAEDRAGLALVVEQLQAAGGKDMWVGDTTDDGGVERLASLIVPLPPTDNKAAILKAAVTAVEAGLGIDEPGTDIGAIFAHVRVRT